MKDFQNDTSCPVLMIDLYIQDTFTTGQLPTSKSKLFTTSSPKYFFFVLGKKKLFRYTGNFQDETTCPVLKIDLYIQDTFRTGQLETSKSKLFTIVQQTFFFYVPGKKIFRYTGDNLSRSKDRFIYIQNTFRTGQLVPF